MKIRLVELTADLNRPQRRCSSYERGAAVSDAILSKTCTMSAARSGKNTSPPVELASFVKTLRSAPSTGS
jgi:hypothetical protein